MSSLNPNLSSPFASTPPDARGALHWSLAALGLWRRAPLALTLLCLVPLLGEALLQQIPLVGVLLSKLVVPLLMAGLMLGVDALAHGDRLTTNCVIAVFRHPALRRLLGLAVLLAVIVSGTQLATVAAVYGLDGLRGVLLADLSPALATSAFMLTVILSGILPALLTMLAMPRVLFDGDGPLAAVRYSVGMLARRPRDLLLFAAINALLLSAALLWTFGVALLLIQPWALAATYIAYRDLARISHGASSAGRRSRTSAALGRSETDGCSIG